MKMILSKSETQKIKDTLVGNKISYGHQHHYETRRYVERIETIEDLYFNKEKSKWVVKTNLDEIPFRDLLTSIARGDAYRSQSNKVRDLAYTYYDCNRLNKEKDFHDYLDQLNEGHFTITDVNIVDDEIEWLKRHVTNITARFPRKYERNFIKNFPGAEYTLSDNSWNYGFTMYFDDLSEIPQSLLNLKNRDGNTLDFDKKLMRNTSYIWKLVKNYPEFNFGRRKGI